MKWKGVILGGEDDHADGDHQQRYPESTTSSSAGNEEGAGGTSQEQITTAIKPNNEINFSGYKV